MPTPKELFYLEGAIWPLRIMTDARAAHYTRLVLQTQDEHGLMQSDYRCKSQVLFPWLYEIIQLPALKTVVTSILGPNVNCWDTLFWIKEPGDQKHVSFHQDSTYWNFAPKQALTVWLSFNGSTKENGAIQYALGSQLLKQRKHTDIKAEGNLLMRGQTVEAAKRQLTLAEVPAGHVSIHHPHVIHGSGPNESQVPRIACGFIFATTAVKPIIELSPESTLPAYGVDEFQYMLPDPVPTGNWEDDLLAWRRAYDRQHANYYQLDQATE